jgi:hypothetical protein
MDAGCMVEISAALTAVLLIQAIERGRSVPSGTKVTEVTNKFNDTAGIPTRTAASTIEALLYELRSGLSCLADEGARNRYRAVGRAAPDRERPRPVIVANPIVWHFGNKISILRA